MCILFLSGFFDRCKVPLTMTKRVENRSSFYVIYDKPL